MDPSKRSLEKVKPQSIHQGLQIAQHLNESCKICRESLKNPEDPIRIPQESFINFIKSTESFEILLKILKNPVDPVRILREFEKIIENRQESFKILGKS